MKSIEEKNVRPVVLPEGNFSDSDDCCAYCDHADDFKDGYLFVSDKVKCELDGQWHDAKHVCQYFQ